MSTPKIYIVKARAWNVREVVEDECVLETEVTLMSDKTWEVVASAGKTIIHTMGKQFNRVEVILVAEKETE